jgi:hypothetical protein
MRFPSTFVRAAYAAGARATIVGVDPATAALIGAGVATAGTSEGRFSLTSSGVQRDRTSQRRSRLYDVIAEVAFCSTGR